MCASLARAARVLLSSVKAHAYLKRCSCGAIDGTLPQRAELGTFVCRRVRTKDVVGSGDDQSLNKLNMSTCQEFTVTISLAVMEK